MWPKPLFWCPCVPQCVWHDDVQRNPVGTGRARVGSNVKDVVFMLTRLRRGHVGSTIHPLMTHAVRDKCRRIVTPRCARNFISSKVSRYRLSREIQTADRMPVGYSIALDETKPTVMQKYRPQLFAVDPWVESVPFSRNSLTAQDQVKLLEMSFWILGKWGWSLPGRNGYDSIWTARKSFKTKRVSGFLWF